MDNIFLPHPVEITAIIPETADTKTFVLRFRDPKLREAFAYQPGQFVEISVFGTGEAPFCIASSPTRPGSIEITVRNTGSVTDALHAMEVGRELGLRGPFGNHFPCEEVQGKDILFIGGGIGLPPLRSLIWNMLDQREKFGNITILYGARTPGDQVYKRELQEWDARADVKLIQAVDVAAEGWTGHVGVVTTLFDQLEWNPERMVAYCCGPPIMIKFVIMGLIEHKLPEDAIISTLERTMKCGVGKCNHCLIGHKYVCLDGPVFSYQAMKGFADLA